MDTNIDAQEGDELSKAEPAPHQVRSAVTRMPWKSGYKPHGPIGIMIRHIRSLGAVVNNDFEIIQKNEAPISIMHTPYQYLPVAILNMARRARTRANKPCGSFKGTLVEIDTKATVNRKQDMTKEKQG